MSADLINQPELYESSAIPEDKKERLRVAALLADTTIEDLIAAFLSDTPKLDNINVTFQNAMQAFALEEGCMQLLIRTKTNTKVSVITYAFSLADYISGNTHTIEDGGYLKLSALKLSGKTLYFSTDKDDCNIEIQQWK